MQAVTLQRLAVHAQFCFPPEISLLNIAPQPRALKYLHYPLSRNKEDTIWLLPQSSYRLSVNMEWHRENKQITCHNCFWLDYWIHPKFAARTPTRLSSYNLWLQLQACRKSTADLPADLIPLFFFSQHHSSHQNCLRTTLNCLRHTVLPKIKT